MTSRTDLLTKMERLKSSAASYVVTGVADGSFELLTNPRQAGREDLIARIRHAVDEYGQKVVVQPIEALRELSLADVPGSDPPEALLDVPLWTESEAPSDLVIRLRMFAEDIGGLEGGEYWVISRDLVGIRLEAPTVRGTPPPPVPRVVPDVPVPVEPLGPGEYPGDFGPVPEKWRPLIATVVHRLVEKDYVGLAADGTYTGDPGPNGDGVGLDLERYPATLRDLPEVIWSYSDHYQAYDDPNVWVVIVPLATIEEGLSSLSLVGQVTDNGVDPPVFHLDIVEVL